MPLDPSIPLQARPPQFMTPADAISLKNMMQQNQMGQIALAEAQRKQQAQEQLRQLFSTHQGPTDPDTGLPAGVSLKDIFAIDPNLGMTIQKNALQSLQARTTIEKNQAQTSETRAKIEDRKRALAKEADEASLNAYDQAIANGVSPQEALRIFQQEKMRQFEKLKKSSLWSPEELRVADLNSHPDQVRAELIKHQDWVKMQQPQSSLGKLEADYKKGVIDKATYEAGKRKATTIQPTMASIYMQGMGGAGGASGSSPFMLNDQAIDMAADRYNKFGELPPTGFGTAGQIQKAKILNRAADKLKAEGKTGEAAAIDQKVNKSIGTAISAVERNRGMILTFEKTARKNAEIVRSTAAKVDDTGVPVINRWVRAGRKSIAGDPDVASFDLAIRTFINEYARVTNSATGGGVTSDTARKEIEGTLNQAMTVPQIESVINTAIQEMHNRETSYNEQLQDMRSRMGTGGVSKPEAPSSGGWSIKKVK